MEYSEPTDDDQALLESDREFVTSVLDARYPDLRLVGTSEDVAVLQVILDGGPYTDEALAEVVALGTALGDILSRDLSMAWVGYRDEYGRDLALRYGKTSILIFPRDMILKRVERGDVVDLEDLRSGVIDQVNELVASGEYW